MKSMWREKKDRSLGKGEKSSEILGSLRVGTDVCDLMDPQIFDGYGFR